MSEYDTDGDSHVQDGDGYPDAGYDPGAAPAEADTASTSTYYHNDVLETGVSSDGDVGYVSLGDGTFYDFGMG